MKTDCLFKLKSKLKQSSSYSQINRNENSYKNQWDLNKMVLIINLKSKDEQMTRIS